MAEANESSNAHLDQSPSPDQFVSREQFDALMEENEKLKTECERLSAENASLVQNAESVRSHREGDLGATPVDTSLVNPESAYALLQTQHKNLIEVVEWKDFLLAESEEKVSDLKWKVQRTEEQLRHKTEQNVENEKKLETNRAERTKLRRKCNSLCEQVDGISLQMRQSEQKRSLLDLKLINRETEIHSMTKSAARNLSKPTEEIEVLRQQNAVYAEDLAKERSDREGIEADKDRLAVLNEECMASREQAERKRITVLTDQNAELAEVLTEERSNLERIEAERERLADVNNENMALRHQARRASLQDFALHDGDETPNNLG